MHGDLSSLVVSEKYGEAGGDRLKNPLNHGIFGQYPMMFSHAEIVRNDVGHIFPGVYRIRMKIRQQVMACLYRSVGAAVNPCISVR